MKSYHLLVENHILLEGRRIEKLWEGVGFKLKEAALTPEQIQQIFAAAESGATAAGGNRTMLGKGKDAAEAVNKAWEDLKTKIQNSAPIANVDSAYDGVVAKIEAGLGGPDNVVSKMIMKYRKFAKEHPIAQGFIYAALIAAAGISGAGLGGAAVLGLLKMADKLLQGEKFSSAAYSGAKTGAMAYGAAKIGDMIKGHNAPADLSNPNAPGYDPRYDINTPQGQATLDQMHTTKQAYDTIEAGKAAGLSPEQSLAAARRTAQQALGQPVDAAGAATQAATNAAGQVAKGAGNSFYNYDIMPNSMKAMADKLASGIPLSADQMNSLRSQSGQLAQMANAGSFGDITYKVGKEVLTGQDAVDRATTMFGTVDDLMRKSIELGAGAVAKESVNLYVDKQLTLFEWSLNRQLGKPRGSVHLTEAGIQRVFQLVEATPNFGVAGAVQPTMNFGTPKPTSAPAAGSLSTASATPTAAPATPTPTAAPATPTPTAAPAPAGGEAPAKPGLFGKAANWLKTKGKNLTTKVTADKLNSAWKKAGNPTDSDQVAKVMQDAGVTPEVVAQTFQQAGLPAPAVAAAPAEQPAEQPGAPTASAPAPKAASPAGDSAPAPKAASGASPEPAGGGETFARQGYTPSGGSAPVGSGAPAPAPAGGSAPTDINSVINKTAQTHGMDAAGHPARTGTKAEWKAQNRAERTAQTGGRPPAAPAPAATPAAGTTPSGFNASNIGNLKPTPGAVVPKPAPKAATPNYGGGPTGYGKTTMTVKEELVREYSDFLMKQNENKRNNTRGR